MDVPVTRLRCTGWEQLAALYERDLRRGALTIRTRTPPPVGSTVTFSLILPSGTTLTLTGTGTLATPTRDGVYRLDVQLRLAPGDLWLIESALVSAHVRGLLAKAPELHEPTANALVPTPDPQVTPPSDESTSLEEDPSTAALEASLLASLEAELDGLLGTDSFQILGVGRNSTPEEIDAAHTRLALKYHPDAYARFTNQRLWDLAGELYIMVTDAYARVSSPQNQGARMASSLTSSLADGLLAKGQWADAAQMFEESLRVDPGSAAAKIGHEVSRAMHFLASGGDPSRAIAHLESLEERLGFDDRVSRALVEARRHATAVNRAALEAASPSGEHK